MIRKQKTFETALFLALGFTIVLLSSTCYSVWTKINDERLANAKEVDLTDLSRQLAEASDYLTSEVRKFAVTLNPAHLRNYWTEINVTCTREKVISRLQDLKIPADELNLLKTAKDNSDGLVNIETRAMKLILKVYEVPEDQMDSRLRIFRLTNDDNILSNNKKVNTAREILYNTKYEAEKMKILMPITQFRKKMSKRIHDETLNAQEHTGNSFTLLVIAAVCAMAYMVFLTRFMFVTIFFPLKAYVLQQENQENAEEALFSSKLNVILKSAILTLKKRLQTKRPH
ncbi:MAG: multi-sensor hybrid histidine kinase [Bacteroidetes bacterium]|nr:multi-sensor hybrid histidine kinase [Bacteroidota bacterium]